MLEILTDIKLIQNKTLVTKIKPGCTQGQSILSLQEVVVQYYLAETTLLPYLLPLLNPALLSLQIFLLLCRASKTQLYKPNALVVGFVATKEI